VRIPPDKPGSETVTLTSTGAAGLGDWTHLAVVYDADADELRLFVNGALSAARTGVIVLASEGVFTVGRGKWNGASTGFFPRGIDDVRAFGRVLTDREVGRVHADVPWTERGSWRFDDGTLRDYSWRANNAVATPVVSFEPGVSGTGLRVDGTTGSAATPAAGATMRDNFTVSAWARLDRGDRVATVVGQDGSRMSGFSLQYRPESNRWAFGARATDSDGAGMVSAVAATPARLSEWVHLTGVYDSGARQLRLYVDGKLAGIRTHGPLWLAAGGLTIGRGKVDGKSAEYFTGMIDEVRVDLGVVPDAEIAQRGGWPTPPSGVLGSFVNGVGDHYTADTGLPVRDGYRFERSLGMTVVPSETGTRPLFACVDGSDAFTSVDPACEGAVVVGDAGHVYTEQPVGMPTMAVYRCVRGQDRFESTAPDCSGAVEGELLGYTVAYTPLGRYASRVSRDHWTTIDGTTPSYVLENVQGWVPMTAQAGTVPLFSCRDGVDEFTSVDPTCAGKQVLAQIGHIWPVQPSGLDTVPIYGCAINGERYTSPDAACEGYTLDGQLGYVLAVSPVQGEPPAAPVAVQPWN
jgi:hypothetical protein